MKKIHRHCVFVFRILLMLVFFSTLSGCITITMLTELEPGYKEDKIENVEASYSENQNSVLVQVTGKLADIKGNSHYFLLDGDTLVSLVGDRDSNYMVYFEPRIYGHVKGIRMVTVPHQSRVMSVYIDRDSLQHGKYPVVNSEFAVFDHEYYRTDSKEKGASPLLQWDLKNTQSIQIEPIDQMELYLFQVGKSDWWKYPLLLVTVPLDIVTSPIQLVGGIIIMSSFQSHWP